jgi:predicted CoA-substrate-specific enzyme activase
MIAAGIDIGSTTTKAAILDGGGVLHTRVLPSGNLPAQTARAIYTDALSACGLAENDVDVLATTGYGRRLVDFGDVVLTEIKACAAGVRLLLPEAGVHTILDVGGQDTKVIALAEDGEVEDFQMNDKCAAGTGRFLEMLAGKLELDYETFVEEAGRSERMLQMNATCAVFAESEVVGLLARGEAKADIAAAAHHAIAARIGSMVRRVGPRPAYCFVGGGARNRSLVGAVEEHLGAEAVVPDLAQTVVAIGAATGAARRLQKRMAKQERQTP